MNTLQFYIKRDRVGFSKKNYPCFELHLTKGDEFVMLGKRMQMKPPMRYSITLEYDNIDKHCQGYLDRKSVV